MMTHPGLPKMLRHLSLASQKVEERKLHREKLRGYLHKIKIVSAQSAKKSVISQELQKMEQHIAQMLKKKIKYEPSEKEKHLLDVVKNREKELDMKIKKVNELLSKLGKKVNEEQFKQELSQPEKSLTEELEEKLYLLEQKYYDVQDNPNISEEALLMVKVKISELKEKIREVKDRS
ncbi:MAG TPA: hypothetical protein VKE88_03510 [Candidatus Nanoarchaeia archaeon]|nr:hypothetical protein [Candidatus Nanoarchaeia archaeon]